MEDLPPPYRTAYERRSVRQDITEVGIYFLISVGLIAGYVKIKFF